MVNLNILELYWDVGADTSNLYWDAGTYTPETTRQRVNFEFTPYDEIHPMVNLDSPQGEFNSNAPNGY